MGKKAFFYLWHEAMVCPQIADRLGAEPAHRRHMDVPRQEGHA